MLRRALSRPLRLHGTRITAISGLSNFPAIRRPYSTERPQAPADSTPPVDPEKLSSPSTPSPPKSIIEDDSILESHPKSTESASTLSHGSDAQPSPSEQPPTSADDLLVRLRARAQEWSTQAAIKTRVTTDETLARLASTLSKAGGEINRATGYEQIDALKKRVAEQEVRITATRAAARKAKEALEAAVQRRSSSQKEVNDLLQRKSMWSDSDVGRFTELVRADHAIEQAETRAREAALAAEEAVEREFSLFMRVILDRYHEEQVWSDKIRSVSSYGSLAVVGVNLLVFIAAIVVVEPWKRKRLAQTFERKVEELEREHLAVTTAATERLESKMAEQDELLAQLIAMGVAAQTVQHRTETTPAISIPVEAKAQDTEQVDMQKLVMALNVAVIATTAVLGAFAFVIR